MNKFYTILSMFLISGCGYTNVSSEWDCPKLVGHKCMKIKSADGSGNFEMDPNKVRWHITKERGPFGAVHTIVQEELIK